VHSKQYFLHEILHIARLAVQASPEKATKMCAQFRQESPVRHRVAIAPFEEQRAKVRLLILQRRVNGSSIHRAVWLHEG
jgi:hypothetical protein